MKTIIAGSRSITDYEIVKKAIETSGFTISTVVSGTANGVDKLGEQYAKEKHIKIKKFPADWNTYGKRAGYLRNVQMAEYADACIIVWDGESKGSLHMYNIAMEKGLKVFMYVTKYLVREYDERKR